MSGMTIGRIAAKAGVGVETVRFYERSGLIERPIREGTGYRRYPLETVDRLRFIREAKKLGFSLKEIKRLLALRIQPGSNCARVRNRARAKVKEIEERVRTLQRMKTALNRLIAACEGKGRAGACPILNAMEEGGKPCT